MNRLWPCKEPGCMMIQVIDQDGTAIGTHCHVDEGEEISLEKRASDCVKAIQKQIEVRREYEGTSS